MRPILPLPSTKSTSTSKLHIPPYNTTELISTSSHLLHRLKRTALFRRPQNIPLSCCQCCWKRLRMCGVGCGELADHRNSFHSGGKKSNLATNGPKRDTNHRHRWRIEFRIERRLIKSNPRFWKSDSVNLPSHFRIDHNQTELRLTYCRLLSYRINLPFLNHGRRA